MLLRLCAILFGIGFIFIGVAGFLPRFMTNGLLLGFFEVGFVHNLVHIVSGVIAIMAATGYKYARLYFQIFGVLYGIITIAGFVTNGDLYLVKMHFNLADNILHLAIAVVALYFGFSSKTRVAR